MNSLAEFHFLYPLWFLLIPLVLLTWWWVSRQSTQSQAWQHFIDERLRSFVISGKEDGQSHWLKHGLLLASLIAVIALAGPSWQKRQLPAFQTQQGLVIVLDLSLSMLATDVKPNRINRARFKLLDLLKIRKEGQTGLVVFAGDAFAVSPLTDDVENIIEQAKNLSPGIMPAQGSSIYRGIDEAALLLQQAGYAMGDILVIADGVSNLPRTLQSAEASASAGYRVSVAAIGTEGGAPIPMSQNAYFRDQQGQLVMAKLDAGSLKEIANKGAGIFQASALSDDDVERFQGFFQQDNSSVLEDKKTMVEHWHNEGIWLLWLLLLPLLLLFRKGYLFSIALSAVVLSSLMPQPASALSWDELWLNDDQRAHRALLAEKHDEAKALFKSKQWKASAAYRNGDFEESADLFEGQAETITADNHYNRGNALAKAKKLEEAMKSYEQALALQGDHKDAAFNLDLLKKMQQEQENKDQQDQQSQDNKDQQDQKDKQDGKDGQQGKDNKGQQQDPKNQKDPKEGDDGQPSEEEKQAEAQKKKAEEEAKKQAEEARKKAEAAQKQAEQSAKKQGKKKPEENEMTEEQKEQAKQTKQWLHQIPDDSAGLWRRKFQYQYRQRQPAGSTAGNSQGAQPW